MTIYLAIGLRSLAPLAMHSQAVAHAVTGECAGDCDICGCSLESRENQTCCCARKRQMQAGVAMQSKGECCPPKKEDTKKISCVTSKHTGTGGTKNDCLNAMNTQQHQDENVKETQHTEKQPTTTVIKCGHPCGKGKLFVLAGFESNELLPIINSERMEIPNAENLVADISHRLVSRHVAPPDPPPRLSQIL